MILDQLTLAQLGVSVLAAGGGGAAVAWGVFRTLGSKWLEERFAVRLEATRHEYAKETERLKFEISRELDRATKLNQREFDALTELWPKLAEAVQATRAAYIRFNQHSDMSHMSDEKARSYLERIGIPPHHIEEILSEPPVDRNKLLARALDTKKLGEARESYFELESALTRAAVFLPELLYSKLNNLVELCWTALVDAQMLIAGEIKHSDATDARKLSKEGPEMLRALQTEIRDRLTKKN